MTSKNSLAMDLLFLDLDGTLIGHSGDVRPSLWPTLEALAGAGVTLSICTGRPYGGIAKRVAERLGPLDAPHIFTGGALVCDARGEVILAEALGQDVVAAMVQRARDQELTLELYTADAIFVDAHTDYSTRHANLLGMRSEEADLLAIAAAHPIIKTQWILSKQDAPRVMALPEPGCHTADATSDVMPEVTFLTITREGVDKGSACQHVMERLNTSPSRAAAVGDSSGDIPMFDVVARPFAMGNSPDALKERYETLPSVEEDGLADLLKRLE